MESHTGTIVLDISDVNSCNFVLNTAKFYCSKALFNNRKFKFKLEYRQLVFLDKYGMLPFKKYLENFEIYYR